MAKFIVSLFLVIFLQDISVDAVYSEAKDKCIEGTWHKSSPSPETAEFKTCHVFKDSSCCTASFTVELMANETRNLYNHSWHRCGQLSAKCQEFWVQQVKTQMKSRLLQNFLECFIACKIQGHDRRKTWRKLSDFFFRIVEGCIQANLNSQVIVYWALIRPIGNSNFCNLYQGQTNANQVLIFRFWLGVLR